MIHGRYLYTILTLSFSSILSQQPSFDLEILAPYLPPNPIIIEAGAHKGVDTLNMAQRWPEGTIYAFEPLPENYRALINTLSGVTNPDQISYNLEPVPKGYQPSAKTFSELPNVKLFPLALSKKSGKAYFYVGINNSGASSLFKPNDFLHQHVAFKQEPTVVETITINQWASKEKIDHIDFMWLDMEGGELDALISAENLLPTTSAVYTEINFKEFRLGNCFYDEVKSWLEARGFVETWKFVAKQEGDDWQGNALFTRPDSRSKTVPTTITPNEYIRTEQFRHISDLIFDKTNQHLPFPSHQVRSGDIIFVHADCLDTFLSTIHPHISTQYILITSHERSSITKDLSSLLDDPKIIAWFGQNLPLIHSKYHPIPVGVHPRVNHNNADYAHTQTFQYQHESHVNQTAIPNDKLIKPHLLTLAADEANMSEHAHLCALFEDKSFYTSVQPTSDEHSKQLLRQSQFVLCPGDPFDSYQIWEALYQGAYPIVKHSDIDPLFSHLPVVVVNSWEEVTETFLEQKLIEYNQRNFYFAKLHKEYWINLINSYKEKPEEQVTDNTAPLNIPEPYRSIAVLPYQRQGWLNLETQTYIVNFIIANKPSSIIHLHSGLGLATIAMAKALKKVNPMGTIYAVDTWTKPYDQTPGGTYYQQFLSNVIHQDVADIIMPCRMSSYEALKALNTNPALIVIDGLIEEDNLNENIILWYPHLDTGGVLCGDDWMLASVARAVERAANKMGISIHHSDTTWHLDSKG